MASTMLFTAVFVLDFVAFLLALAAEQTRSTAKVVIDSKYDYYYCFYDSNIGNDLGSCRLRPATRRSVPHLLLPQQKRFQQTPPPCSPFRRDLLDCISGSRGLFAGGFGEECAADRLQGGAAFIMVSSFASKLNTCWSELEEEEGAGAGGDLGAYTPI
ncbi:unnamed protein product [Linum trigynum]|uniref:Uncharacterized protein n=1 Tax=Linum trigynum TaxID=586398 RepID=A0AAV2CAL4_9ROSI